jgi:quinol monooxygenase YgiN
VGAALLLLVVRVRRWAREGVTHARCGLVLYVLVNSKGGAVMFALVVRFYLRDEEGARGFDALVAETAPRIRESEPGTLIYAVHKVKDAPLSRVFYELYESREAFDAHEKQPHVKHFLAERERFLTGHRVEFLETPSGKGV